MKLSTLEKLVQSVRAHSALPDPNVTFYIKRSEPHQDVMPGESAYFTTFDFNEPEYGDIDYTVRHSKVVITSPRCMQQVGDFDLQLKRVPFFKVSPGAMNEQSI